jgi:hypothetical protein
MPGFGIKCTRHDWFIYISLQRCLCRFNQRYGTPESKYSDSSMACLYAYKGSRDGSVRPFTVNSTQLHATFSALNHNLCTCHMS